MISKNKYFDFAWELFAFFVGDNRRFAACKIFIILLKRTFKAYFLTVKYNFRKGNIFFDAKITVKNTKNGTSKCQIQRVKTAKIKEKIMGI